MAKIGPKEQRRRELAVKSLAEPAERDVAAEWQAAQVNAYADRAAPLFSSDPKERLAAYADPVLIEAAAILGLALSELAAAVRYYRAHRKVSALSYRRRKGASPNAE